VPLPIFSPQRLYFDIFFNALSLLGDGRGVQSIKPVLFILSGSFLEQAVEGNQGGPVNPSLSGMVLK